MRQRSPGIPVVFERGKGKAKPGQKTQTEIGFGPGEKESESERQRVSQIWRVNTAAESSDPPLPLSLTPSLTLLPTLPQLN